MAIEWLQSTDRDAKLMCLNCLLFLHYERSKFLSKSSSPQNFRMASFTRSPPNVAPAPNIAAFPNLAAMFRAHSWCCSHLLTFFHKLSTPFSLQRKYSLQGIGNSWNRVRRIDWTYLCITGISRMAWILCLLSDFRGIKLLLWVWVVARIDIAWWLAILLRDLSNYNWWS